MSPERRRSCQTLDTGTCVDADDGHGLLPAMSVRSSISERPAALVPPDLFDALDNDSPITSSSAWTWILQWKQYSFRHTRVTPSVSIDASTRLSSMESDRSVRPLLSCPSDYRSGTGISFASPLSDSVSDLMPVS